MVQVGGIATGLDVNSLVSQLVSSEISPKQFRLDQKEAGYQSDISALGTLKSALNEFASALDNLDSLTDLRPRSVTNSNEALFTVSAGDTAITGSYDIEVVALAQEHRLMSGTFDSSGTEVGTGTLTITRGTGTPFTVTIDSEAMTLADVRDAINNASDNPGVTATIINVDDGSNGVDSRLVISSGATGLDETLTITAEDDDGNNADLAGLSQLIYPPTETGNVMEQQQAASDAHIRFFNQDFYSGDNSISDAIDGVTLELLASTSDSGSTGSVSVALDTGTVNTRINDFVTAYNTMMGALDTLGAYDEATRTGGVLLGDPTLRGVVSALRREISTGVSEAGLAFTTLAEIGITTQQDGTLAVDSTTLSDALDDNFNDVAELFAGTTGYAARLNTLVEGYTDSDGPIDARIEGLNSLVSGLADERTRLDVRAEALDTRYRNQFAALDELVAQLNTTGNFLAQNLATLPGFTRNNR